MDIIDLPQPLEFEWDEANKKKIWLKYKVKYKVTTEECEETFGTEQIFCQPDELHSDKEITVFIVFTVRKNKVRVVSANGFNIN